MVIKYVLPESIDKIQRSDITNFYEKRRTLFYYSTCVYSITIKSVLKKNPHNTTIHNGAKFLICFTQLPYMKDIK